ncbi:hypothetical protein ACKWTF_008149 [Chironomus riparius]
MEQHHNYEYGETFGFINAAFAEPENFSRNPEDQASKTNIPSIINDSVPPAPTELINQSSPYDLTTDCRDLSKDISNGSEENQSESIIQPQNTEDIADKEDTNADFQEKIESSENANEGMDKSIEENATSEKDVEESATRSSENIDNEAHKVVESKPFKRDISGKKRRRIVVLNDDDSDSDGNELKKELLNRSSDVEQDDKQTGKSSEQDADSENDSNSEDEKELSTNTSRNFLKAKYLLKTAVIIEDPDKNKKKKKKQRVLDSDDEEQMQTSVDDIGLLGNENDNENEDQEAIFTDDIVIINNDPIIVPEEILEEKSTITEQLDNEPEVESTKDVSDSTKDDVKEPVIENLDKNEEKVEVKNENVEQKSPTAENPEAPTEKTEEDDVNAELDKIKPMDDDDDFFKFNDTTDEDEQKDVSNDKYFGSADKQSSNTARRGRKRGPVTRRSATDTKSHIRKRGDQYERDFVDDSDSSSYSESVSSSSSSESSSSSKERVKKRLPSSRPGPQNVKVAQNIIRNSVTITRVPTKKDIEQKGRFYDKSRNIPNDIYFGDVNVPLHVLHSRWNSDGQSDRVRKVQHFPPNRSLQRPINTPPLIKMPIPTQNTIPQAPRPSMQSFR